MKISHFTFLMMISSSIISCYAKDVYKYKSIECFKCDSDYSKEDFCTGNKLRGTERDSPYRTKCQKQLHAGDEPWKAEKLAPLVFVCATRIWSARYKYTWYKQKNCGTSFKRYKENSTTNECFQSTSLVGTLSWCICSWPYCNQANFETNVYSALLILNIIISYVFH